MPIKDNELMNFNNSMRSMQARARIKKNRFAKYHTNNRVIAPDTIPIQMYGAYGSQALIEAVPTTYDIISEFKEVYVPVNPQIKKYETTPFDWPSYNETLLISRY
jgi:hypothetical protein